MAYEKIVALYLWFEEFNTHFQNRFWTFASLFYCVTEKILINVSVLTCWICSMPQPEGLVSDSIYKSKYKN